MTGRIAVPDDYPTLDAMWIAARASVRQLYTLSDALPDWSQYRVYGSADALGLQFAMATLTERHLFSSAAFPAGLVLADRCPLFIGPRAGLAVSVMKTAHRETLRAWVTGARGRLANGETVYGIVRKAWGRFQLFSVLGWQTTPFDDESTLLFDTIDHADATL